MLSVCFSLTFSANVRFEKKVIPTRQLPVHLLPLLIGREK